MRPRRFLAAIFFTVSGLSSGCTSDLLVDVSTGSIQVIVESSGGDPDLNGYTVQVDQDAPKPIGATGQLDLSGVAPGSHAVTLAGLDPNCSAADGLSRTVTVPERGTAVVRFTVTCPIVAGAIDVAIVITGESLDPDGITYQVDNLPPDRTRTSKSFTVKPVYQGTHTVTLQGVAPNCTVPEGTHRSVTLAAGASQTVQFTVTCAFIGITIWDTIPLPPSVKGGSIWGTSASDLFVAGHSAEPAPHYGIWHYDGVGWTEQVARVDTSISRIWGFSASDVYAVGNGETWYAEEAHPGAILHYDGATWSDVPGPPLGSARTRLQGIWGSSPRDLFLGGSSAAVPDYGLIAHFDGQSWSGAMPTSDLSPEAFHDLSGTSATDVWAIGYRNGGHDCETCNNIDVTIGHFDGRSWTRRYDDSFLYYAAIWASSPQDVWVVGSEEDLAVAVHYDGTSWTRDDTITYEEPWLRDVWASSASDVYAVGPSVVLHYDGSKWSRLGVSGGNGVWGLSRNDVFILRENAVLHGKP